MLYQWVNVTSYFEVKAMIVEKIVTNIRDLDANELEKRHKEKVYLESAHLMKRIQRVTTDHDRELGIRLKDPKDLEAGDVLFMDDKNMIIVDVLSDDLLVIKPRSMHEMGTIAHQLGNRHLPAQFEADDMLVQYDYLVEELLHEFEITIHREERTVDKELILISHRHE